MAIKVPCGFLVNCRMVEGGEEAGRTTPEMGRPLTLPKGKGRGHSGHKETATLLVKVTLGKTKRAPNRSSH